MKGLTGYHVVDQLARERPESQFMSTASTCIYFGTADDIRLAIKAKADEALNITHFCNSAAEDNFKTLLATEKEQALTEKKSRLVSCEMSDIIFVGKGGNFAQRPNKTI